MEIKIENCKLVLSNTHGMESSRIIGYYRTEDLLEEVNNELYEIVPVVNKDDGGYEELVNGNSLVDNISGTIHFFKDITEEDGRHCYKLVVDTFSKGKCLEYLNELVINTEEKTIGIPYIDTGIEIDILSVNGDTGTILDNSGAENILRTLDNWKGVNDYRDIVDVESVTVNNVLSFPYILRNFRSVFNKDMVVTSIKGTLYEITYNKDKDFNNDNFLTQVLEREVNGKNIAVGIKGFTYAQ